MNMLGTVEDKFGESRLDEIKRRANVFAKKHPEQIREYRKLYDYVEFVKNPKWNKCYGGA